ncbi:Crp/Fnr family transcriptional regulator [Salipaludibacillus aurantiacus]|uniref:CRP/FNR family transcriptional regulator, anaerobic regulatory protein n=1 Tax=Salipaludibacillus aurantiacus TaxID=1601833 RepID=A0A1H9TBW3_9BACI|nr:Crp/Fnr family transcriptional regulator [Salipaludibacillus aurantiacus]SER94725.1 CRP/FNR family transcriptional regulator, anaerobic regulatory protein [Salipaludibacillus aurantiacus]
MSKKLYNYKNYNPFFEQLSEENQQHLLLHGEKVTVPKNKILFYEGETVKYIYLITKGQVQMSKMTMDDKKFVIHIKRENDIVGEFSLFNDMRASMTAEAKTPATLIRFDRDILEGLFIQNGEIATVFIKLFARNTQATQAKFSDLLLYGKTGAFYSILIRFAHSYGIEHPEGIKIDMKLTNQELAYFIGSTRETVNRMFNELKKDGVTEIENGYIVIKKIEELKKHLHCEKCPLEICTLS